MNRTVEHTIQNSKKHGKPNVRVQKRIVLAGTYRKGQLERWKGFYNYPIEDADHIDKGLCKAISELWLFNGTKQRRCFLAKYLGVATRQELIEKYDYPATGPAHANKYLLFSTQEPYPGGQDNVRPVDQLRIRLADFARSPKVRMRLKSYLASSRRGDGSLDVSMPPEVLDIPPDRLMVAESTLCWATGTLFPDLAGPYSKAKAGNYRVASLFAGCGGLDLGFLGGFVFLGQTYGRRKFDVVWANEINPSACRTYERNIGPIVCGDVKDVLSNMPGDVDVIMGGFPCQDISINGKMLGINGKRSSLYTYIVEAVKKARPKVFVAENVGSLLLKQNEYSFRKILGDFEALDYDVTFNVYHAEAYGVPQTRERIIFVGTRKDLRSTSFNPPAPTVERPITAGEALRDLENMPENKSFSHIWSAAAVSGEQGNRRMVENRPGYTIRAECHGNIQFHYRLPRRLSMREAARIQSFPDTFVFPCGIRETERQVGNAVPPVLAWHIAGAVERFLDASK